MLVVVSDTSPLRALAFVGAMATLKDIYEQVLIPPAVCSELTRPRRRFTPLLVEDYPFLQIRQPTDLHRVEQFMKRLDRGEAEAIALAVEVHADLLLIDERIGRETAASLNLKTTGALGVLVRARHAGLIGPLGPLMDRLTRDLGFHISERTRAEALRQAG